MEFFNFLGDMSEAMAHRPKLAKKDGALRFGILGAATIAPQALIYPAKSHAEVIVAAVAARDEKRARAFAKKWSIPIVHKTYDDLINDPALDCIYVPLPVALHYEWALKALQAGKHVLLEKPSAANADEASALFRQPLLSQPNAPVLLEARHYQFHPAWHTFLSLFDPNDVVEASARVCCPATMFPAGDIRYQYEMAGGTLMDLGTYPISALRGIFNAEPISVTSALPEFLPGSTDHRCDRAMEVTYEFPGGRVGSLKCDLSNRVEHKKGGGWWSWLFNGWPYVSGDFPGWLNVTLREKQGIEGDTQVTTQKKIVWNNFMGPHVWHRIDINTTTTYRDQDGTVLKTETSTESTKAYVWPEGQGGEVKGEDFWTTYRFMLEGFVDRVKGRKGSGFWIDGEDSIQQTAVIDQTYQKAGMELRPTSKLLSAAK